jgi:S1-C subfamily serine protease
MADEPSPQNPSGQEPAVALPSGGDTPSGGPGTTEPALRWAIPAASLPPDVGGGTEPGGAPPPPPGPPSPSSSTGPGGLRSALLGAFIGALIGALVAGGVVWAVGTNTSNTTITRVAAPTPTAAARPSPQIGPTSDIAAIIAKAEPAIVAVTINGGPNNANGAAGTGFIITPDGYIATNNHVVEGASSIQVQFTNGNVVPAKTIGRDPSTDLAVLKIDGTGLPAVSLGDSNAVQIGDAVVAIGNALALQGGLSVTNGIISGLNRQVPEQNGAVLVGMLQTDAAINPGNSGGPLLNAQGQVIGINTAVATPGEAQNIGFAIPISTAILVLTDLRTGRKPAFLGISTQDLTPEIASQLSISATQGAVITQVSSGTPAATAGLKKNDVIVQIGSHPIKNSADVQTAVRSHTPGDTVSVVFLRNGSRQTVNAKLTTRPTAG